MSITLDIFNELGDFSVTITSLNHVYIKEADINHWADKPQISNKRFHCSIHFEKVNGIWVNPLPPYFSVPFKTPEVTVKQQIRILEIMRASLIKFESENLESFLAVHKEKEQQKIDEAQAKVEQLEKELELAKADLAALLAKKN